MTARDRIVIMVVLAIGAIAASWMLVISPKRDKAASLGAQISSQQSQLDAARSQVAAGETARAAFAGQYAELAKLGEAVPPDDNVPSLIFELQNAAGAADVSVRGVQLTGGVAGSSSSSSSSSSSTPSTSSSGASASTAAAAGSQLPPGATVGAAGLPTEQFTFTLAGNFFHLSNFFNRLQNFVISRDNRLLVSGRLMTINAINLSAAGQTGFPNITATVSATTYIVPATEGTFGGATPAGPATAPQAHASTSGSSTAAPAAAITPLR